MGQRLLTWCLCCVLLHDTYFQGVVESLHAHLYVRHPCVCVSTSVVARLGHHISKLKKVERYMHTFNIGSIVMTVVTSPK